MSRSTYRRYRGNRRRIGVLIPTLIILIIIAAGALIYVNANLTQGDDGEMLLKLPFSEKTVSFGEKQEEEDFEFIIEEPVDVIVEAEVPEYETRIEKPAFAEKQVFLDSAAFEAFITSLPADVNTVILEIKAEDGTLATNEEQIAALEAAVERVKTAGLNPVAQISCFKDNLTARENQNIACRTKNKVIWLDYNNITWLSPYEDGARNYLNDVINDVYELGFREILLTNVNFPVEGKTDILYYDKEAEISKRQAIVTFLDQVKSLCDAKGDLRAAIRFENLDEAASGQALEDLTQRFYRIYADDTADIYNNVRTLISEEEKAARLVITSKEK